MFVGQVVSDMRRIRFLLIVALMAVVLLVGVSAVHSQTTRENCRYFADTDHWVCDEFLEFYEAWGGVEIFGYPLTEECEDPRLGLRVQYFQRARMEWHPYNNDPYKVQLGLLVDEQGYDFPLADPEKVPAFNSSLHHYFPETRHVVFYEFLNYFREKGGLDIFGYPRSEFMYEDGYIVQYFQRARMEWHPEVVSGSQMRLTKMGEVYIERFGVPEICYEGGPPRPDVVTKLNVSASVRYAITGQQGTQTVFVYVNDQRHEPLQGAAVAVVIHYQSGDQSCEFDTTNARGFTLCSFDILRPPPGQRVVIDVTVTHSGLTATTQTSFLPWW